MKTSCKTWPASCSAASLWLDTLLMSAHLQLTNAEFRSAMGHRLGLTHTLANSGAVQCWCARHLEPGDTSHAMTCKSLSGAMTLRHHILKGIWRRIACRAGGATSLEPVLRPLQGSQSAAIRKTGVTRGHVVGSLRCTHYGGCLNGASGCSDICECSCWRWG